MLASGKEIKAKHHNKTRPQSPQRCRNYLHPGWKYHDRLRRAKGGDKKRFHADFSQPDCIEDPLSACRYGFLRLSHLYLESAVDQAASGTSAVNFLYLDDVLIKIIFLSFIVWFPFPVEQFKYR